MQKTSDGYTRLRTLTGSYYNVRLVRGETTYGMDKLKTVRLKAALFDGNGPQIGGVHSTICEVKLIELSENWPRMASFTVEVQLTNGSDTSEWLTLGKFWTDERKKDKYGNLQIVAFDSMLMLEQPWTDKVGHSPNFPAVWPITAKKAADLISEATGVSIDAWSVLDNTVPFIGLDTTSTAREVLASIAVGCGGNWMLTQEGNLRLIRLKREIDANPAVADIAIADIAVVGTGANAGVAYLGKQVKNIEENEPLTAVTGVEITSPDGTVAFAGDRTGYVIKATCAFASSSIAALCLSKVEDYVYTPFEASAARIDPAAEVGDYAHIDKNLYPIITADWTIAPHITANLSAPFEEEVDHEYVIVSESAKTLRKAIRAATNISDEKLLEFINGPYAQYKDQIQAQVDGKAQTWYQPTDPALLWVTDDEKENHIGDLWYCTDANSTLYQKYLRYNYYGQGDTGHWDEMTVMPPDDIFDKFDGKAQVFLKTPTTPYHVGDLWFTDQQEIYTCTADKETGAINLNDWSKKNKYTDDSLAKLVQKDLADNYKTAADVNSAIEQSATDIKSYVGESYVSQADFNDSLESFVKDKIDNIEANYVPKEQYNTAIASMIQQTSQSVTTAITQLNEVGGILNEVTSYMRYGVTQSGIAELVLGVENSPISLHISNEEIAMYYNDTKITYWNQQRQYTPLDLTVPLGGKFTLGSIRYQPRTSGNVSLIWVGQDGNTN